MHFYFRRIRGGPVGNACSCRVCRLPQGNRSWFPFTAWRPCRLAGTTFPVAHSAEDPWQMMNSCTSWLHSFLCDSSLIVCPRVFRRTSFRRAWQRGRCEKHLPAPVLAQGLAEHVVPVPGRLEGRQELLAAADETSREK